MAIDEHDAAVAVAPSTNATQAVIRKTVADTAIKPNLANYAEARSSFSWDAARRELDGLPRGKGLNIAHEAIDRHACGPRRNHLAIRWIGRRNDVRDFTYAGLQGLTNRFANVLNSLGAQAGDRVFVLAGRVPELYITALGTLKQRCVFCPLFSAFGPEPIRARMEIGGARFLVTTQLLYERKVRAIRAQLPELQHVLVITDDVAPELPAGTHDFNRLMAEASDQFEIGPTASEDAAFCRNCISRSSASGGWKWKAADTTPSALAMISGCKAMRLTTS
ncbi:MAG: AMP-binding protein, partial [Acidobacteriia bacterium]|nr:AMP-binding protein [Terriglobia bacterium]